MTFLVDTPVVVDHFRGDKRAVTLLSSLFEGDDRVWAATLTRTEVLAGIRPREREPMGRLFELLSWVDIDAAIADAAGEMARRYHRSHARIDTADYLIAAAARSIDATLLTLNVRHFPMFPGLEPAYR